MTNPIVTENNLAGTAAWQASNVATTQVQAYCDAVAYDPGQTVTFYVSTQVASTTYTLTIFRLGYYGGNGGRQIFQATGLVGVAQGYWDNSGNTLNNCPTAIIDATTHRVEAGWASVYTWTIPGGACTGVYVAQFTDANGKQTYCTFVVRGNTTADYVYVRPVTTDQAYNNWGGFSLYTATRATKVSFNRPIVGGYGTEGLFRFELTALKWLEKQGYNLSYITSVDVHANPSQLLQYGAMLSLCHDEYWSKEMRDGVELAISCGVGAAFLGANASYWQIRFENDAGGHANRTITCYKVQTANSDLATDPFYGVDNTRVTSQWRDAVLGRPENTMIGIMYSSFVSQGQNVAWVVDANATSPYLQNTGLVPGQANGYDLVGYEIDKQQAGGPANLQIIGTSPLAGDTSHTTVYRAKSGALVFAAGSIGWTFSLGGYRFTTQSGGTPAAITPVQNLLANIMTALLTGKTPPDRRGFAGVG